MQVPAHPFRLKLREISGRFRFLSIAAALWPLACVAQDQPPVPVLSGYLTAPATAQRLEVDGRPVLLPDDSGMGCPALGHGIDYTNGVPVIPPGAEVNVYGSWRGKEHAFAATGLCIDHQPEKVVTGAGFIDAMATQGGGTLLLADGRLLTLPRPAQGSSTLTIAGTPKPGDWLRYSAQRQKDGSYVVKTATIERPPKPGNGPGSWQPVEYRPPTPSEAGRFRYAHLSFSWKLPYEPELQARITRLGNAVIPAWQKELPASSTQKWQFLFIPVDKAPSKDCVTFPNGMIFVSRKTIAALTDDAQMSALLAGCVAEVMDEEAYRLSPSVRNTGIAEAASAAVPYAGLPGIVAGSVYENHLVHVAQQQSARIAVTYLLLAGLPVTAAPAAWETLDGKHGVLNQHSQPGDRAETAYAAVANAPQPGMIGALVSK